MAGNSLFSGKKVLISFAAFVAALLVANGSWIGAAAVGAAAKGAIVPDMLFSYAPSSLAPMFAALGEQGRAAYLAMNAFDFIFAAAYGVFYFLALGWLAHRLFPSLPAIRFVSVLGLAGALCDEIENAIFRIGASGSASIDGLPSAIASLASTVKYSLNYAAVALVASGLLALGARRLLSRGGKPA